MNLDKIPSPEKDLQAETAKVYNELIKRPEISEALDLLNGLSPDLRYHDKNHTLDVIKETILFALADGASPEVIEQQAIAAAWHDVGYLERYNNNEPVAVAMFQDSRAFKSLPAAMSAETIANILDTQLVMKNDSPYPLKQRSEQGYVLDADLSNLGRDDFFQGREAVAAEGQLDLSNSDIARKFYKFGLDLLRNHDWQTASAQALRQTKKESNLRELEGKYNRLFSAGS